VGVGAGLYMYDVIVKMFTFAISSRDEFLCTSSCFCSSLDQVEVILVRGSEVNSVVIAVCCVLVEAECNVFAGKKGKKSHPLKFKVGLGRVIRGVRYVLCCSLFTIFYSGWQHC